MYYDRNSKGAAAYEDFAEEFIKSKRGKTNEENYRIHICFYTCRITFADLVREKRTFEASGVTGEKAATTKSQRGEIKLEPDKFTFTAYRWE